MSDLSSFWLRPPQTYVAYVDNVKVSPAEDVSQFQHEFSSQVPSTSRASTTQSSTSRASTSPDRCVMQNDMNKETSNRGWKLGILTMT